MDAWTKAVDTSTDSAVVISNTLNSIINGLEYDAAVGIITSTFFWFLFVVLTGVIPSLLFCCYSFTQPKKETKYP